jgi:hypothetical protein
LWEGNPILFHYHLHQVGYEWEWEMIDVMHQIRPEQSCHQMLEKQQEAEIALVLFFIAKATNALTHIHMTNTQLSV